MIYANEWDKDAAHWLSCLPLQFDRIDARSITEVKGSELFDYEQCHFFAGIGGWPLALEIAEWGRRTNDARVWTGSCPCQPFSAAGKRKGTADDRHLWPEFKRLIDECRPATIFGEQVASKDGREWLATVRADLEAMGYAVGAADLCAASVGAPHIRQRLFWVAHCDSYRRHQGRSSVTSQEHDGLIRDSSSSRLGNAESNRRGQGLTNAIGGDERIGSQGALGRAAGYGGDWRNIEFIECRDGKARPVKPGVCLLAHGVPGRVAQLRGLGNAIVPQVAAEFVMAFMDLCRTSAPPPSPPHPSNAVCADPNGHTP